MFFRIITAYLLLLSFSVKAQSDEIQKKIDSLQSLPYNEFTSNLYQNEKLLADFLNQELSVENRKLVLEKLATAQSLQGKYEKSANTSQVLFDLYAQTDDQVGLAWSYYSVGWQIKSRDQDKALDYLEKSVALFELHAPNDKRLAEVYDNYGQVLEFSGKLEESLTYYKKSLTEKEKRKDSLGMPYSLQKMGVNYAKQGDVVKSARSFNEAIRIARLTKDSLALAETYAYIGDADEIQGQKKLAIYNFKKSLEISERNSYPYLVRYNVGKLAELYEATSQPQSALRYHKQFVSIKDSMLNLESQKTISQLEVAFDTAEKEREIESLNQKTKIQSLRNKLFAGLALVGLLGVGFLVLLRNRQKLKYKAEMQQAEMNQLQAVLNAEEGEKERIARELHDGIGQMIAAAKMNVSALGGSVDEQDLDIHQNTMDIIDQTAAEVRSLSHELLPVSMQNKSWIELLEQQVGRMNIGDKIIVEFEHNNPQLKGKKQSLHALRIVQELLKNGQKHAKTDRILVKIKQNEAKTSIFYKDWGVGIPLEKINNSSGIGWRNINERIKALNGTIDIKNCNPGTEILVIF